MARYQVLFSGMKWEVKLKELDLLNGKADIVVKGITPVLD